MTETTEIPVESNKLILNLTPENQFMLQKLASWGKVVAVVNIIFGIINCLSIFAMMVPAVVMGVFAILMGTKLNSAVAHLRYAAYHGDSESFGEAFHNLRQYMLYNGIFLLMIVTLMVAFLLVAVTMGPALLELMEEFAPR